MGHVNKARGSNSGRGNALAKELGLLLPRHMQLHTHAAAASAAPVVTAHCCATTSGSRSSKTAVQPPQVMLEGLMLEGPQWTPGRQLSLAAAGDQAGKGGAAQLRDRVEHAPHIVHL